jgi:putative methionine-R-sulfoxide reductase with GAF domain
MDSDPRSEALRAVTGFLVSSSSLADTLTAMAHVAVDAAAGAKFAGLTMLDESGEPTTGIFTDVDAPEIDAAQYESGRGPCLDAWRQEQVVRVDDVDASTAYPEFERAAADHGVHSTISLPLMADGRGIGALNLYSTATAAFSEQDEAVLSEIAWPMAAVLSNAQAYWGAVELGQQLREAMDSRSVIEQAKGVLMATSKGVDADQAFVLLRAASQRENRKLRDIASEIVERHATG